MKIFVAVLLLASAHAAPGARLRPRPTPTPRPVGSPAPKPLFQRLGGKPGATRIANEFVETLTKDARLLANPQIAQLAKSIDKPKAKARLADRICKDTGGPCKEPLPVIENPPKGMKLQTMEWLFVMQDANTALDRAKVPVQEQKELIGMLIQAQQKSK